MTNDDRVNTTTFPPSHYGCQEDGYCPNKQARTALLRNGLCGACVAELS